MVAVSLNHRSPVTWLRMMWPPLTSLLLLASTNVEVSPVDDVLEEVVACDGNVDHSLDLASEEVVVNDGNVLSDGEKEEVDHFPPLPSKIPQPTLVASGGHVGTSISAPKNVANVGKGAFGKGRFNAGPSRPNAWTSGSKKVFMNSGLGGKLTFTPPTSDEVDY